MQTFLFSVAVNFTIQLHYVEKHLLFVLNPAI